MAFIEFHDVGKTYKTGEVEINALHDVNFEIEKGELVVIVGRHGYSDYRQSAAGRTGSFRPE